jgi:ABC-type uncharacterized transport system permease subunit
MTDVFQPASAYALITFAVGFALGTLRVLWLAPKVGHTTAVLLELPLMLCASFLIARWAVARWCVPARPGQRLAMGAAAFAILMFCEALVSITLFGNDLSRHLARYLAPAAWPGLAAQLVFAGMPLLLLFTDPRS